MNILKKWRYRNVPHLCFTCDWFKMTYNSRGESVNRFCKNPKHFTSKDWINHVCQCWILAEDIEKRGDLLWGVVS